MSDIAQLNYRWSQHLVAGFFASGVREAVISPGSRSTPLALALLRQPGLNCTIAVDERSAAFFALGIGKASRQPALLLATSGTAPANWLPAIIEASYSGVPLIALSADRPPELHDCGANQTVAQEAMFAPYVRATHIPGPPHPDFLPGELHALAARIVEQSIDPYPGPVHLNQAFREPLVPAGPCDAPPTIPQSRRDGSKLRPDPKAIADLAGRIAGRPGLILCGELRHENAFPAALTALADTLDCPIIAEPLSGLRFGRHDLDRVLTRYSTWLTGGDRRESHRPDWILRFGNYPVTRPLQRYLDAAPIQAWIDSWPRLSDPARRLTDILRADPTACCDALRRAVSQPCPPSWHAELRALDIATPTPKTAWHIPALLDEIPDDSALFIGNSLAIRQFDSHAGSAARSIPCYGNRGASGIDGNISTALGLATIHGRVTALFGDLTCQHDLGGLALANGRDAIIIAVNNGGGGIFDHLPQASLPEFELAWRTPQHIHFDHAAATFGLGYRVAEDEKEFRQALRLALKAGGPWLIELKVPGIC